MASTKGADGQAYTYTLFSIVANSENKDAQDSHSMHVLKTKSDLA